LTGKSAWNNVSKEYLSRGIFVKRLATSTLDLPQLAAMATMVLGKNALNYRTRPMVTSGFGLPKA
jgi:hypothetical protein